MYVMNKIALVQSGCSPPGVSQHSRGYEMTGN